MDVSLANELLEFFKKYLSFYKDFLQLETDKYNDLETKQLNSLQKNIKQEEVFMLRSRGFEKDRETLLSKTELPKATFRELIPLFPLTEREQIETIYQELSQVLLDLKEMNRRCNALTQLSLHHVQQELDHLDKQNQGQKVYTPKAVNDEQLTGILSKKV